MGFLHIQPPQGSTPEQELSIIIGVSPKISPPQLIGGPGDSPLHDDMLFNEAPQETMLFNNTGQIMEFNNS